WIYRRHSRAFRWSKLRHAFPSRLDPSASRQVQTANLSPSPRANGPISISRGTQSPSSTWISPAWARRTLRWPGSRSEPTIPTARRGRSRSRGRPTGERLSWLIIDRTTYPLSIFDERLLMILTQRLRALRSFARPSPTALSYLAIRRGPRSRRPDDSR